MSQPPYDAPPPAPQPAPGGKRPTLKGVWIGIVLMVLAIVVLAVGMFAAWKPLFSADAVFPADGQEQAVDLPAGEDRGVWLREGQPASCRAVDADGNPIRFDGTGGDYNVNEWNAVNKFDTGAGDVVFTCQSGIEGTEVRISPLPGVGTIVVAMLLSCGLALLLGIGGLVLLIVTLVRRSKH